MRNQVYGTATMSVSVGSNEDNEKMALLSENYRYHPLFQKSATLILEDIHGVKRELTIHNFELELDSFFTDGCEI